MSPQRDLLDRLEASGPEGSGWLDAEPGPAAPRSDLELERLVQGSVDAWAAARPAPRRAGLRWATAAAVVLGLGASSAWAMSAAWRAWERRTKVEAPAPARPTAAPREEAPLPEEAREAAGARGLASEGELGVEAVSAKAGPAVPARPPHQITSEGASSAASDAPRPLDPGAQGRAEPPPSVSGVIDRPPPSRSARRGRGGVGAASSGALSAPEAESRMARASRLRRLQRWAEAVELYRQVRRALPGSPSAYVAAVAEAQIRLEHLGQPARALEGFEAAADLRPTGPLDPEVRLGLGDCLAALGRTEAARAAWRRVVAGYPDAPSAAIARRRLEAPSP